ncbi:MAG: DUF192 domain-containing protein [Victivallales bacterium]|jgi:uncharacterized membrane protein (UPF0127 family)|nr:DUF192 domain-containing protein [Victivallales bacterium]
MIFNLDSQRYVAHRPKWALAWHQRLRGMIGRCFDRNGGMDAMIFPHCNAIHTMWMSMPIDVIFLNAESKVLKLCPGVRPWKLSVSCREASTVIELPENQIKASATEVGHHLNLNSTLSPESIEKLRERAILKTAKVTVVPQKVTWGE